MPRASSCGSLALNPNLSEAHLRYADYLASIGRFDEALAHDHTAFALDPLSGPDAICWPLHVVCTPSRRFREIIQECHKTRELPPDFTKPFAEEHLPMHASAGSLRRHTAAATAVRRKPTNPTQIAEAAQTYAESGNKERSAARFSRNFWLWRRNGLYAANNIATVYAALGKTDRAFRLFSKKVSSSGAL